MHDSSSLEDSQIMRPKRKLSLFMMRLFARVDFDNTGRTLKKILNIYHLIFLGISCAIGAGAYSVIGIAAQKAGPSIALSFLIVGLLCFFTCFPYAEFAAKIQSAGFSYSFIYATCGELLGYMTGHALHLMNMASTAICARCWSAYLASFLALFGIYIPKWLYDWEVLGCRLCILGALIVCALCILMLFGMKESTTVNNIVSIMNLTTLVFAIIAGAFYVDSGKYYSEFFPFGFKGIFAGMGLTFYAFLGFEGLTCFTEEAIKPERDMPISLMVVLTLATVLYGGVALVMTGMAPLEVMSTNESLLGVFKYRCPLWMGVIISIGSIAGLTAAQSAILMCQPRTFYSMAYDRLLPKVFMKTNPKTHVPDFAVIVTGVIAMTITLFFDVEMAGNAASVCGLLVSAAVDLSVIVARYDLDCGFSRNINRCCSLFFLLSLMLGFAIYYSWSFWLIIVLAIPLVLIYYYIQIQPQVNIPTGFACPCVPLIPLIGALSFILMATTVDPNAWNIILWYMVIGLLSYFLYGYWQSKLNPYRTQSVSSVTQAELPPEVQTEMKERLSISGYMPEKHDNFNVDSIYH